MTSLPLMHNPGQIAYVANDLDRAMALLRDNCGCGEFHVMRDIPDASMDIALAYSGNMNYEIIRHHDASGNFYSDWIAGEEGFVIRHHHFCMYPETREEMDRLKARHIELGNPIVMDIEMPGHLDVFYADATTTLGHYLEYVRLEEGGRAMFAAVPGSPFAQG